MSRYLRRFRPGWKLSIFSLLMLPVLISLGFWQLDREAEKRQLQALYEARRQAAPLSLEELPDEAGALAYRPVRLRGEYDERRAFLLDNRTREGRPGLEVIVPFRTESGQTVLVNRGWVARGPYREELPAIPAVPGRVSIEGSVHVPAGEALTLAGEGAFDGWPRLLQSLDIERMASELGVAASELFPFTVRLDAGEPGALRTGWPLINTLPEKHRAYAVQWFAMALALVVLFLYAGFRRESEDAGKSTNTR